MKILLAILLCFSTLAKQDKLICPSLYTALYYNDVSELPNDKWKHCSLSCKIRKKCDVKSTVLIGAIKEFADLLGPGNFEIKDMQANLKGVHLAQTFPNSDCIQMCSEFY